MQKVCPLLWKLHIEKMPAADIAYLEKHGLQQYESNKGDGNDPGQTEIG